MVRKLRKQIVPLIGAGIGLGGGGLAIERIGGQTAASSGRALTTFSGFLPAVGVGLGGAAVVRSLSLLQDKKRRRR